MKRILNIGSINIDYVYTVPHFVQAGETLSATSRQLFPGGKGLNQSVALSRAGGKVSHAGMVGEDEIFLMQTLEDAGVDTSLISQTKLTPTGHTIIQVNEDGENCILLFPGANREIDKKFVDTALAGFSEGDILVLQNEVSCVDYAIKAAKAKGMLVVFNPSPFESEIISKYPLDLIDWWLLNEIEGQELTGQSEPSKMLNKMGEMYPKAVIVLTLGEDGVLCLSQGKVIKHDSYKDKIKAVDTTAAGDTFTGYFISSIAKGMELEEAIKVASMAAAISVSRLGAAVSIPLLDEVLSFA